MPLVRIDLAAGKSAQFLATVGDVIYEAMLQALKVPENDRFMILNEHLGDHLSIDERYLDIARTSECIIISVTLNEGRTLEAMQAFYRAVADGLYERLHHPKENVLISLTEVKKENWSFGNGEAQ